jgi:hypothetical protein
MNKKVALTTILFSILAATSLFHAGPAAPTAAEFKAPVIQLVSFEVPQYDGYWYYSKKIEPTQGEPGDRGAPLPMSFVFEIENPNPFPVLLEDCRFTVSLDEDFDLVTVNNQDGNWIPARRTEQVRVTTMITVRSALLSLMVTGGYKLKARDWTAWQALERWWKGVSEYTLPVTVREGVFTFRAGEVLEVLPFEATFP